MLTDRVHPGFAHGNGLLLRNGTRAVVCHRFWHTRLQRTEECANQGSWGFENERLCWFGNEKARLPTASTKVSVFVLGTRAKFFGVYRLPTVSFPTWNVFLMSGPSPKRAEQALRPSFSRPASLSQVFDAQLSHVITMQCLIH